MSVRRDYKAVVIGSGAGGAPAAATLAAAWGDGVALVEAGPWLQPHEFTQIESQMVPRLYARGGALATEDGAIGILQGQVVGGSTVINDAICFRPPEEIVYRWTFYGVPIDYVALGPYVLRVEAALGVAPIAPQQINRANYLVGLGAANKVWWGERLAHNSPGCVQCGFRHIGCFYGAKQSMDRTYVAQALAAGAVLHADTAVERLERVGERWRVVAGATTLTAEHVVLAAGVVQTPTILLRSGVAAGEGVQFHLETVVWGDFDDPVDAFNGIPMSYGVLEFADVYKQKGPGFLMEGVGVQPMAFSVQPQAEGDLKREIMSRYRHLAGVLALVRSRARGAIVLGDDGQPRVRYPLVFDDTSRIAQFFQRGSELFFAAGARRALLAHRHVRWVDAPPDPRRLRMDPGDFYCYTAHPFGGANRGTTCDDVGRVVGQRNLWVLDASAFPEALGVNPQVTIAALSLQGAERLLADAGG